MAERWKSPKNVAENWIKAKTSMETRKKEVCAKKVTVTVENWKGPKKIMRTVETVSRENQYIPGESRKGTPSYTPSI